MSETRVCTKCGECKGVKEFTRRLGRAEGAVRTQCKVCLNAMQRQRKNADIESERAYNKAQYRKHIVKRRESARLVNPEIRRARQAEYRKKFPERIKESLKAWYEANKEYALAKGKLYYQASKDKEHVKEKVRLRINRRRREDPMFAIKCRMSRLISISITSGGYTKKSRTHVILGCTWLEFKSHIERQFLNGMNWENRSQWHLDHIVPMATAKTEEDILALNHHTNLRPLWSAMNIAKSDTITHLI